MGNCRFAHESLGFPVLPHAEVPYRKTFAGLWQNWQLCGRPRQQKSTVLYWQIMEVGQSNHLSGGTGALTPDLFDGIRRHLTKNPRSFLSCAGLEPDVSLV